MMMGVLLMSLLQFIEDWLNIGVNLQKEFPPCLLQGLMSRLLGLGGRGILDGLMGCNKLRVILNLLHVRFELLPLRFR